MKSVMFLHKVLLASAIATALSSAPLMAAVTDQDITNDATTTNDVVSYGLGLQGQRFSPLDKLNADTVKNLVPAFVLSYGDEKQRGQEAQPLVANGKIFVTASYSRVFAVDAKTGEELWQYDHRLPDGILPCCDVVNRGGALYDNLFIFATLD
ncbi:MAG TPA: PQQ-dependent dehydrogenase, methanol/ethanol family, partial [Thiolinea sp.]|nr:PQQ-dependent dehydrogenase, methanol/ethanol family [Thiolinea sp.]